MDFTQDQIDAIVREARDAAYAASDEFFRVKLGGVDQYACGFAWTNIYKVKGNSRLGRMLKAAGIRQDYTRTFQLWNPAGYPVQNIAGLCRFKIRTWLVVSSSGACRNSVFPGCRSVATSSIGISMRQNSFLSSKKRKLWVRLCLFILGT